MTIRFLTVLPLALALGTAGTAIAGDHEHSATDMTSAISHYVAIAEALAADSVEGIADHAQKIALALTGDGHMTTHGEEAGEQHTADVASPGPKIRAALTALQAEHLGLDEARAAFKDMSRVFLPLVADRYDPAEEDPRWAVFHCPMAKGSWIQSGKTVANPYYGSKMLRCGSKVADLAAAGSEHTSGEDQSHGHHQHP